MAAIQDFMGSRSIQKAMCQRCFSRYPLESLSGSIGQLPRCSSCNGYLVKIEEFSCGAVMIWSGAPTDFEEKTSAVPADSLGQ